MQFHPIAAHVFLLNELATLIQTEGHDRTNIVGCRDDGSANVGLLNMVDERLFGQSRWIVHLLHIALFVVNHIGHVGDGGNDIHIKLSIQTLLNDFHVQQSQEAATKAKT